MKVRVNVVNTGDPKQKVRIFKCQPQMNVRDFIKKVKSKLLNPPLRSRDGKVLLKTTGKEVKSKKIRDVQTIQIVDHPKNESYDMFNLKMYKNSPLITFYNKVMHRMKSEKKEDSNGYNLLFENDSSKSVDSCFKIVGPLGSSLSFTLNRTLRLPSNTECKEPPDLGSIPVFEVSQFKSNVPSQWIKNLEENTNSFFIPMYENETFFFKLTDGNTPHAIQVQDMGESKSNGNIHLFKSSQTQNYFVFPEQRTINGFINETNNTVEQFLPRPILPKKKIKEEDSPDRPRSSLLEEHPLSGLSFQAFPICSTGTETTSFKIPNSDQKLSIYKSYSEQVTSSLLKNNSDTKYIHFETGLSTKLRRNTLLDIITDPSQPEFDFKYRLITLYFRPFPEKKNKKIKSPLDDTTSSESSDDDYSSSEEEEEEDDDDEKIEVLTISPNTPFKTLIKRLRDLISVCGPIQLYISSTSSSSSSTEKNEKNKKKMEKIIVSSSTQDIEIFKIPNLGDRCTIFYKLSSSSLRFDEYFRGKEKRKKNNKNHLSSSSTTNYFTGGKNNNNNNNNDIFSLDNSNNIPTTTTTRNDKERDYNSMLSKITNDLDLFNNNNNNNNNYSMMINDLSFLTTSSSNSSSCSSSDDDNEEIEGIGEEDLEEDIFNNTKNKRKKRRRRRKRKRIKKNKDDIPLPPIDYHLGNEIKMVRGINCSTLISDNSSEINDPMIEYKIFLNNQQKIENNNNNRIIIYICNQKMFFRITGEKMPYPPLGKQLYIEYNIPFFKDNNNNNIEEDQDQDKFLEEYLLDEQKKKEKEVFNESSSILMMEEEENNNQKKLVEMGFDLKRVKQVLGVCNDDFQQSLEVLLMS